MLINLPSAVGSVLTVYPFPSNLSTKYETTDIYYYYMYYTHYLSKQAEVSSLFWLRSGEAYLNLAEAEAYMGHEDQARNALNTLRKARIFKGAADLLVTSTGSSLITDIRKERRYRVCSVQPEKISITHNYTLYKERGQSEIIETRQFVLTEDDDSWTLPIPQEVLDFNTGMPNNPNKWREYTVVPTVE